MIYPSSYPIKASVLFTLILCMSIFHGELSAQIFSPGTPLSFNRPDIATIIPEFTVHLPQNAFTEEANKSILPKIGHAIPYSIDLIDEGLSEEINQEFVLIRLSITSPDAKNIGIVFKEFFLTERSELFVYNNEQTEIRGAFTARNNKQNRRMNIAPIRGNSIVFEILIPKEDLDQTILWVEKIVHYPEDMNRMMSGSSEFGFNKSSCTINTICPDGDHVRDQIQSVVLILNHNMDRLCSGTLLNNTSTDYTPYILTAFHCADWPANDNILSSSEISQIENWTFIFNYESNNCDPSIDGNFSHSIFGATYLAHRQTPFQHEPNDLRSDMLLVKMDDHPLPEFAAYYSGWSNASLLPTSGTSISHPMGDVKKIAIVNAFIDGHTISGVTFYSMFTAEIDTGGVQNLSSGSALFDQNNRIVGQLYGGDPANNCQGNQVAWYGKVSVSWDGSSPDSRLKDWLDPGNTGATTLNGMYNIYVLAEPVVQLNNPGHAFPEFSWNAVDGADQYIIYRRCNFNYYGDCGPSFSQIGSTTALTFIDYFVMQTQDPADAPIEEYEYAVKAVNSNGTSPLSNRIDVFGKPSLFKANTESETDSYEITEFTLNQNYPNPFNPSTTIRFSIPQSTFVSVSVYDMHGREVLNLMQEHLNKGHYNIRFDASTLSSGVYFYELRTPTFSETRKMTLIR